MAALRKPAPAKEPADDVLDMLRNFGDLVILAEPMLLELWQSEGLTYSQKRVLRSLLHSGPMSANELAQVSRTLSPSLTRVLTKLEEDGLVIRAIDLRDRRRIMISLTAKGRKAVGSHEHLLRGTVFSEAAEQMSPSARAQFTKKLREFRTLIEQQKAEAG